jgi:hypothetical protein
MQPTFLPWLGYFALIDQADVFVFLDDVQFSKQSWQSRNRVSGPNGPVLLSLPVARKPSKPLIRDARLADKPILPEILPRVEGSLGRAPCWSRIERLLTEGLAAPEAGLAEVNIRLIEAIAGELGLGAEFRRSSRLELPRIDKSDRLLRMCETLGADTYLSPMGSIGYLREANPFFEGGIRLRFQNFEHPVYEQRWGAFQSHMSVVDAIAHVGADETLSLVRQGTGDPYTMDEALEVCREDM